MDKGKKCPICTTKMYKGRLGYWCPKLGCKGYRPLGEKEEVEKTQ